MPRKKQPWFRFYVEAVHDRKLRRLKPEVRWLFVACLAAARQSPEPGWLLVGENDPMVWDDIVDYAHMPLKAVEVGMDALQDAGVIGFDTTREAWFVPNWDARQYESDNSTERTRKHRSKEQGRNVPTPFDGTTPETEADTDTESSSSGASKYACIDAIEDDDDPVWIEAKGIARDLLRANHEIRTPGPYVLKIVNDLKAKGWTPTIEAKPCFDPACDDGWIQVSGNADRACSNCRPYVADYLMAAN